MEGLHGHLVRSPLLRRNPQGKSEQQIQTELRSIIFNYMKKYFEQQNRKNPAHSAKRALYWEGEEGNFKENKPDTFASKNYPDFIIIRPYRIAIEYKKSGSGSVVKHAIGQSLLHTLGEEFDFVYCLFQDETKDKRIVKSVKNDKEKNIIQMLWEGYNIYMKFI